MVANIGKKRRVRNGQLYEARPSHADIPHDWEKDDEELELEEVLFGRSKKRAKANGNFLLDQGNGDMGDGDEVVEMEDDEVC